MSKLNKIIFIILSLSIITGCALNKDLPPQLTLVVKSNSGTNNGVPFHIALRSVDTQVFLTDSYQDVAEVIFSTPPDTSVLGTAAIIPGSKREISVNRPEDMPVGIYCLFTEPGEEWKMMLSQPLYSKYTISLEQNRIIETEKIFHKKKGLIQRIFSSDQEE